MKGRQPNGVRRLCQGKQSGVARCSVPVILSGAKDLASVPAHGDTNERRTLLAMSFAVCATQDDKSWGAFVRRCGAANRLLLRRWERPFGLGRTSAHGIGFLLLQRVVGPGVFARVVKVPPVRQRRAGSRADRERRQKQKRFHAGIEPDGLRRVNAAEKLIARRPASREPSFPSGAMD